MKLFYVFILAFLMIIGGLAYKNYPLYSTDSLEGQESIQVLTYSTFIKSWGPGVDIAKSFEKETGVKVEWVEVSNAGMILENLSHRSADQAPDAVVGIDFLSLQAARDIIDWERFTFETSDFETDLPKGVLGMGFLPYNWSPMTFIFKRSELETPRYIDDLLDQKYANSLALQDPRTSSTGLYFLIWILSVKGEEAGLDFLRKLKSSIRIVSPSWSAAYSLFQNDQVPMVFSFFTSPIYHYVKESDYRYQPVYFDDPHIYSMEFAGIPKNCNNCSAAKKFLNFLKTKYAQKKIMEKNYMLPVIKGVKDKTPFDFPKTIRLIPPEKYRSLIDSKKDVIEKWENLSL